MARIGRLSCLGILITFAAAPAAEPDPPATVATTLAVQDAMRTGREHLLRGEAKAAVDTLEAQLSRINGNPAYLSLLREAYGAYVKELQFAQRDEQCAVYQKRLQILEKSATNPPNPPQQSESRTDKGTRADAAGDDPFQQSPRRQPANGRALLPEAERAFAEKRFRDADGLFAQVYGSEPVDAEHAPQWAYCKLYAVVAKLREAEAARAPVAAAELEGEVTAALKMAANDAKLETFGRQVLESVRQRAADRPAAAMTVTHRDRGADGWARAESPNFRLAHNQPREFAERLLRAAEQARTAALEKWTGTGRGDWKPACEVVLYATAAEYSKATGKAADTPGHATYKVQGDKVVGRRLDLRADEPNLLTGVVPHEATHLVLGDLFADAPLPRWADEGMAVLAEPRSRVDRFVRTLQTSRRQGKLVPLEKLFGKGDYPDAALITVFYVQSVSVVDFLVTEKGPETFVQFLRDTSKSGLDSALQKHYDCRGIAALQDRWLTKTFGKPDSQSSGAGGQ